jgi:excisionase family DNA binding protein
MGDRDRGSIHQLRAHNGLLTQQEAAEMAGCSKDTIVRARQAGRLPHARLSEHRWMIPIDDLVESGLYDPDRHSGDAPLDAGPDAGDVEVELARALARVSALEEIVARQDSELAFLRQLTTDTLSKRTAA